MKFIKLTEYPHKNFIYIRKNSIETFGRLLDESASFVKLDLTDTYKVIETPSEILEVLRA